MNLRVAVDARELTGRPTGVGRYLRELLLRWAEAPYAAGADCLLLAPAAPPDWLADVSGGGVRLRWETLPGAGGTAWEQGALASAVNRSGAEVCFAPAYTAPLRVRAPIVLAMHDVSFAAHPEWFGFREGVRRRILARWSAQKAAAIVTLTRFSASEIVTRLGVRGGRIHVTPLAVDYRQATLPGPASSLAGDATPPPPRPDTATRRPTAVLFVGSIFERRHLPLLVQGVARAAASVPDVTLQIIGDNRTTPPIDLPQLARSAGIGDAVEVAGYVDDSTLEAAYRRSGIFAFLSAYEGFGLPPLEAMQAGLATVVLDTAVAREVYGDGAVYVPPGDADALGRSLARLAADAPYREALVARGREVARSYRWEETAERTWRVLADSARRPA